MCPEGGRCQTVTMRAEMAKASHYQYFCPFRAFVVWTLFTQGVALGYIQFTPSGRVACSFDTPTLSGRRDLLEVY